MLYVYCKFLLHHPSGPVFLSPAKVSLACSANTLSKYCGKPHVKINIYWYRARHSFYLFVISLTIHTLFFLGMFSPAGYSFFLSWVSTVTPASGQIIFFLPGRGWGVGCRAGFEPALTTQPRCTLHVKIYMFCHIKN